MKMDKKDTRDLFDADTVFCARCGQIYAIQSEDVPGKHECCTGAHLLYITEDWFPFFDDDDKFIGIHSN